MEVTPIDSVWTQTKRLNFRSLGLLKRGAKTRVYMVLSRRNGNLVGHVRWNRLKNGYEVEVTDHKYLDKFEKDLQSFCEWATIGFRKSHPKKQPGFKKRRARRILALLKKPDGGGLDKRYAPVVQ